MRLKSLDCLRGVAALIVVFHHALLVLPGGGEDRIALLARGFSAPMAWLYLTPLRLLVADPAAVLLFFVLNGLVLTMTFIDRDDVRYLPFAVKRITRIWLPFALVIVVAALLTRLIPLGPVAGTSVWFTHSWKQPASIDYTLSQLVMTGTATSLDNPMWTLVHEMRVSLIFPALVALTLWNWPVALAVNVAFSLACVKAVGGLQLDGVPASIVTTGVYVFLFVVGIALAKQMHLARRYPKIWPAAVTAALWVIGLVGLCLAPGRTDGITLLRDDLALVVSGFAAALVVMLCAVEGKAFTALLGPVPTYLGRISYSLYLNVLSQVNGAFLSGEWKEALWARFEPPRVCRRPQLLRDWGHDEEDKPAFST